MVVKSKGTIHLFFDNVTCDLRDRNGLKSFIRYLFSKEKKELESLNYVFCDDQYLLNINKRYLHRNEYTDIITFDLSRSSGKISGEIYISINRVRENAIVFNSPFQRELRRVMFHGALHLCGYADKTRAEKKRMREKEDAYLNSFEQRSTWKRPLDG